MIRHWVLGAVLVVALATPLSAQWVVFDPSNFANAVRIGALSDRQPRLTRCEP